MEDLWGKEARVDDIEATDPGLGGLAELARATKDVAGVVPAGAAADAAGHEGRIAILQVPERLLRQRNLLAGLLLHGVFLLK